MLLQSALCFLAALALPSAAVKGQKRTFEVSFDSDTFLMDGKPFKYVSGSVHYFRIPRQYWKDRLRKVRLLGFNAITTYVEWSLHEPHHGVFNFEKDADVVHFLKLAQEEGLYVILRPGPYICAEREFGGYPAWLLTENSNMKLRTSDPSHTFFIEQWLQELFTHITPLLYGNGGPIIMVQVENEYGSYPKHDKKYLIWLRDLYRSYIFDKAVLFTTDGWYESMVKRGRIPGVFSTVDFGTTKEDVMKLFAPLRKFQSRGPLVNSEFYTGWLSYWGEPMATVTTKSIVQTMGALIAANASFNCYMIHGGTNFGFTSGSGSSDTLKLSLTSYDYDAPISEAGDLTDKYMAIRELLKKSGYTVGSDAEISAVKSSPKGDYGTVQLKPVVSLLDSPIGTQPVSTMYPLTMEAFNQSYGFIAYTHTVNDPPKDPSVLQVNVRDRALVLLDNEEISVLAYTVINETPLPPSMKSGMNLTLLVENQGRRNYQLLSDCTKGIIANATLDGKILENWSTVSYPLLTEDIKKIENLTRGNADDAKYPLFLTAAFTLPPPAQKMNEVVKEGIHGSATVVSEMVSVRNPDETRIKVAEVERKIEQVQKQLEMMPAKLKDITQGATGESHRVFEDVDSVNKTLTESNPVQKHHENVEDSEAQAQEQREDVLKPTPGRVQKGNRLLHSEMKVDVQQGTIEAEAEDESGTDSEELHSITKREATSFKDEPPLDTFLDMTGWGKGFVFINGYNLGRYWHIGSQMTLYVPGVWLNPYPQSNQITILELHFASPSKTVRFVTEPIFKFDAPSVRQLYG